MADYLKKTKMRKLGIVLGFDVPVMKKCSYKFCRGSEWLSYDFMLGEKLDCRLKIAHDVGHYILVTGYEYNSSVSRYVENFHEVIDGEKYKNTFEKLAVL